MLKGSYELYAIFTSKCDFECAAAASACFSWTS